MDTPPTDAPSLTTGAVARLCGVSTGTVARWVKADRLTATRTPGGRLRFQQGDVDRLIAEGRTR